MQFEYNQGGGGGCPLGIMAEFDTILKSEVVEKFN